MTPKIAKICEYCGSDDVTHDASVSWDVEGQQWVVAAIYDNADCNACNGETNIVDEILQGAG